MDLYGSREKKFEYLNKKKTDWKILDCEVPYYFFAPKNFSSINKYNNYFKIIDLFPLHNMGLATGKDEKYIGFLPKDLDLSMREKLKIHYRPFDDRYVYYDTNTIQEQGLS